jgi:hypothetical protein
MASNGILSIPFHEGPSVSLKVTGVRKVLEHDNIISLSFLLLQLLKPILAMP